MNNYLLQLLKEVNMLIIPGLGAINIVNKSTGEFMFMNYMKHDDGTLAKHIAEKEGWELNDAKNLIAKFVREVNAQLDKGETYDMFQFGTFKKVNGDIEFEQWNANESNSSTDPVSETKTEELKEEIIDKSPEKTEIPDIPLIIEEPIVEKTIESHSESTINEETPSIEEIITPNEAPEIQITETPEPEPIIQSIRSTNLDELLAKNEVEESSIENIDEPKVEKKIELNVIDKSIESIPEQIIEPTIEKEIPQEKVVSEPEVKIVESVKTVQTKEKPVKAEKENKAIKPVKEKKKTKPFVYILWGFVVLILGASTFVAVKFDSLKKDFPFLAEWAGDKTTDDVVPSKIDEDINSNGNDASESEEPTQEVEIPEETVQEETPVEEKVEEVKIEKPVKSDPKPKKDISKPVKVTSSPKPKKTYSSGSSASSIDSSLPFHIIAGSFGSKENANRLVNKLKANGFTSAAIEDRGGSFRVSAKGFSSKDAALSEISSVQSIAPGAWLYEIK